MCIICNREDLSYKYLLDCSECVSVRTIPNIKELKSLNCSKCPLITKIPIIKSLKELNCSNCPLITIIPIINQSSVG